MNKIEHTSKKFKILFYSCMAVIPFGYCALFLIFDGHFWIEVLVDFRILSDVYLPLFREGTLLQKWLAFFIESIPVLISVAICYCFVRLFKLYEQGNFFSKKHTDLFHKIAYLIIGNIIAQPIRSALLSLALTFNNPPGERFISVSVDFSHLVWLITALLIILISWIMDEGRKLQEDAQGTI